MQNQYNSINVIHHCIFVYFHCILTFLHHFVYIFCEYHRAAIYKTTIFVLPSARDILTHGILRRGNAAGACVGNGQTCIDSCDGLPDGDYQWCATCFGFAKCCAGMLFPTQCAPVIVTVWDDDRKICRWRTPTCGFCKLEGTSSLQSHLARFSGI